MKEKMSRGGWIVTIPVSLMALGYVAVSFLPRMRAISEVRQQLRQREDFIVQADKLRATSQRVAEELKQTRDYCDAEQVRVVDERQLGTLFSRIGQLAEANGARILRFEPQPAVTLEQLRKIPVMFSFSAPFAYAQQLARALEELPESIWVDHLKIEKQAEDGESVKVEMKLVLFADNPEKSD